MPVAYIVSQEGLSVDLILWRKYGRRGQDLLAATLALNVGLAAYGTTLPVGVELTLPDLPVQPSAMTAQPVDLFA